MRKLANTPWSIIALIAIGWTVALLFLHGVAVWHALRSFESENAQGQLAAVGFDMTLRGALVTFGPPLALVVLRAIASRTAR